ncbi:50S ribosomal protein L3 [Candidatus Giovannonibacteria bacterium]|nr:50S ribosomal protein L3 [Candidatus Giovannonibacteria bacterium]
MKFALAKKIQMSELFDEEGNVIPVTVLNASPLTVVQIKGKEKDGYEAVQAGFGEKKAKNIKKPQLGHFGKLGSFQRLVEFRNAGGAYNLGDKIDISVFEPGEKIKVSGISKGKGFQGVVKRHGFAGGPRTHGQKHSEREPGSIGATWPQRVLKGKRMAGRMGGRTVTVRNLEVVKVEAEKNLLYIKGALPGRRGTLLKITSVK